MKRPELRIMSNVKRAGEELNLIEGYDLTIAAMQAQLCNHFHSSECTSRKDRASQDP